jgi:hypothetical protein
MGKTNKSQFITSLFSIVTMYSLVLIPTILVGYKIYNLAFFFVLPSIFHYLYIYRKESKFALEAIKINQEILKLELQGVVTAISFMASALVAYIVFVYFGFKSGMEMLAPTLMFVAFPIFIGYANGLLKIYKSLKDS